MNYPKFEIQSFSIKSLWSYRTHIAANNIYTHLATNVHSQFYSICFICKYRVYIYMFSMSYICVCYTVPITCYIKCKLYVYAYT